MRSVRLLPAAATAIVARAPPDYRLYIVSESGDIVTQLTWDGSALHPVKTVPVGIMPADIDGPHNVTVSPDGRTYYVSGDHATPHESMWDSAVDRVTPIPPAQGAKYPTTTTV